MEPCEGDDFVITLLVPLAHAGNRVADCQRPRLGNGEEEDCVREDSLLGDCHRRTQGNPEAAPRGRSHHARGQAADREAARHQVPPDLGAPAAEAARHLQR